MKVWQLMLSLLSHVLHGRGGDDVYLVLEPEDDGEVEILFSKDWKLSYMTWEDDRDRYVSLVAYPEKKEAKP